MIENGKCATVSSRSPFRAPFQTPFLPEIRNKNPRQKSKMLNKGHLNTWFESQKIWSILILEKRKRRHRLETGRRQRRDPAASGTRRRLKMNFYADVIKLDERAHARDRSGYMHRISKQIGQYLVFQSRPSGWGGGGREGGRGGEGNSWDWKPDPFH